MVDITTGVSGNIDVLFHNSIVSGLFGALPQTIGIWELACRLEESVADLASGSDISSWTLNALSRI